MFVRALLQVEVQRWSVYCCVCVQAEATVSDKDAMKNFLKRTRKNTRRAAFSKRLRGKWHGKMTDPMFGDTMQIFEWLDSKTVKVMIIGQQLTCSYKIRTDLDQIDVRPQCCVLLSVSSTPELMWALFPGRLANGHHRPESARRALYFPIRRRRTPVGCAANGHAERIRSS